MAHPTTQPTLPAHAVLAVVLQVREEKLDTPVAAGPRTLPRDVVPRRRDAWRRGDARSVDPAPPRLQGRPARGRAPRAARHLERARASSRALGARDRVPRPRAAGLDPRVPEDTRWHPVHALPETAFDHGAIVLAGRERLRGKLSYTNLGFALAPDGFTLAELRNVYAAALGYEVSATNLKRVLLRRGAIEPVGEHQARPCRRASRGGVPLLCAAARGDGSRSPSSARPPDDAASRGVDRRSRRSRDHAALSTVARLIGLVSVLPEAAAAAAVFWRAHPARLADERGQPRSRPRRAPSPATTCTRNTTAMAPAATPGTRASTVTSPFPPKVCVTTSAVSITGARSSTAGLNSRGQATPPMKTGPAALKRAVTTPTSTTTIQAPLTSGAPGGRPRRGDDRNPDRRDRSQCERDGSGESGGLDRPPVTHVRHREGEKESREGSIEPERVRILHHTSDHGSRGGAADPEHVEQKARADEDRPFECPSPPRERPRLVDDRLGLHEPAKRPPGEDRCNGDADRDVARVQEHGREDRGHHRPAGVEDGDRCELGGSGERRRRHDDRGNGAESSGLGQDSERQPEERRARRKRDRGANPVADTRRAVGSPVTRQP